MATIIGVFQPGNYRLLRSNAIGKLLLSETGVPASLVDFFGNIRFDSYRLNGIGQPGIFCQSGLKKLYEIGC